VRNEQELLVDCLNRLNWTGIPYMLTGSMASNLWGVPRTTHDLDFVLLLRQSEVPRFVAEFSNGFFLQPDSILKAFQPPRMFNAIDESSALKVDFWLLGEGPFEQEMFRRRVSASLFGETAWVATAEDVILHKLYWNQITPSERQLYDAAGIYAVQSATLDRAYIERWSEALGVAGQWSDLVTGRVKPKQT
jgi:hypothetical protein